MTDSTDGMDDQDEDFAETAFGAPTFDSADSGPSTPGNASPSPTPAAAPAAQPPPPLISQGAPPPSPAGEDEDDESEYAATVLDGFTRDPVASGVPHVASTSGGIARRTNARPRPSGRPPPRKSDTPLYVVLVATIVVIVGLTVTLIIGIVAQSW